MSKISLSATVDSSKLSPSNLFVGIDVSKRSLDVHFANGNQRRSAAFENSKKGLKSL